MNLVALNDPISASRNGAAPTPAARSGGLKVTTVAAGSLSAEQVAAWSALQAADGTVDSPFFRPELAEAAAAVRGDVEVAILEDAGQLVGFLPFQRGSDNVGRPLSGRLSDFQGVVLARGYAIEPLALVRACGLKALYFDHLLARQEVFRPFHWTVAASPYMDISRGVDAYLAERRAAGAGDVSQALNKKKRAEKQMGPVRFEPHTRDSAVLARIIDWKTQQYQRTRVTSVFSFGWVVEFIEQLLDMPATEDFAATLSALYLGDTLAAAHFGIRSRNVQHWWFPAYDSELSKYSPGSQLLLELARSAAAGGIERIDLGAGQESYKQSFMTGATDVAIGAVDRRPVARAARRLWHHTKRWVRESPLRGPAMAPWRVIRSLRDRAQFR
jgi:CelD/BcsL family acetyltransferase involved in cellulose biosynthesis